MNHLEELGQRVIAHLRHNNHEGPAHDLEILISRLELPELQREEDVVSEIKQRCNVRWLGDLHIRELSLKEWWGLLEKLSNAAERHR